MSNKRRQVDNDVHMTRELIDKAGADELDLDGPEDFGKGKFTLAQQITT